MQLDIPALAVTSSSDDNGITSRSNRAQLAKRERWQPSKRARTRAPSQDLKRPAGGHAGPSVSDPDISETLNLLSGVAQTQGARPARPRKKLKQRDSGVNEVAGDRSKSSKSKRYSGIPHLEANDLPQAGPSNFRGRDTRKIVSYNTSFEYDDV